MPYPFRTRKFTQTYGLLRCVSSSVFILRFRQVFARRSLFVFRSMMLVDLRTTRLEFARPLRVVLASRSRGLGLPGLTSRSRGLCLPGQTSRSRALPRETSRSRGLPRETSRSRGLPRETSRSNGPRPPSRSTRGPAHLVDLLGPRPPSRSTRSPPT